MNARDDEKTRDDMLHRLLACSLRQSLGAGGADCPTPDILAAYFDRLLSSHETSHWESHFSTCARCQQVLAALATTEVEPGAVGEPEHVMAARPSIPAQPQKSVHTLRGYLNWSWLAPAAAAAVAIAVWLAIRPAPRAPVEVARESQSAPLTRDVAPQAPAQAPKELAKSLPPQAPAPAAKMKTEAATPSRGPGSQPVREQYARAAPAPPREAAKTLDATGAPSAESRTLGAAAAPPGTVSEEKDKADQERAAQRKEAITVTAAPIIPGKRAAESGTPPQVAAKTEEGKLAKAQPGVVAAGAADRASQAKPKAMLSTRVAYRSVIIASPSRSVLWRVGSGGNIERSLDAGRTWQAQVSNVTADLLSGSAPSETVCWVVGRAGTILRTTDGEHWEKISSPALLNWSGVEARDALNATVTAGTVRYITTDGGHTWLSRVP